MIDLTEEIREIITNPLLCNYHSLQEATAGVDKTIEDLNKLIQERVRVDE